MIETLRVASATASAAPEPRVVGADGGVAVGRGHERLGRALDPQDGRAATRTGDGVRPDRRVVLVEDAVARREVRRAEQGQQHRAGVHPTLREAVADGGRDARCGGAAVVCRGGRDPMVDDRVAGQGTGRDARQLPGARCATAIGIQAAGHDRDVAVGRDPADDRDREAPPLAHLAHRVPAFGEDRGAHPFLRLGDHHLEGLEARFAARDRVQIDDDPGPRPIRGLRRGAGDAAGTQVLEALDQAALDELEARLDQQLLGERVADLDGGPLRRVVVGERRARQDRGATDPVASGRRAVEDHEVARAGRGGQGQQPLLEEADGHDVDQRVARVARVEDELATDRRHADAIAVAADAAHDPIDQVAGARVRRIAEAQGIEDGDRARPHREDVAQDPTDAGRGTLVRLDRRRVVVRLDLERDRQPVADRDDAGVLARTGDDAFAGGRERAQQRLRALVRAVLAPHDAEHGELEVVGIAAAEPAADRVQLVVGHPEAVMERLHGSLGHGHREPTAPDPTATWPVASCAARSALSTSERTIAKPSSDPRIVSEARSG